MKSELRQFLDTAAKLGWALVGFDGHGHPRLYHPATGARASVSATPSDTRSRRNELARLERLAGRKLPRQKSGHYRHQPQREVLDFRPSEAERQRSAELKALELEARSLQQDFRIITADTTSTSPELVDETRRIVKRYEHIRRVLADYYRLIPQIESW